MYSIISGIVHPPLYKDLSNKNYNFLDIGETLTETLILQNLMKEILDINRSNDIVRVFQNFINNRALPLHSDNDHYQKILNIFKEYNKHYTGTKPSAIRFYLVKRDIDNNTVTNVIKRWNVYREINHYTKMRKRKYS